MLRVLVKLNIMRNVILFEQGIQFARAGRRKIFFRVTADNRTGFDKGFEWFGNSTIKRRGSFHSLIGNSELQSVTTAHAEPDNPGAVWMNTRLLAQERHRGLQVR